MKFGRHIGRYLRRPLNRSKLSVAVASGTLTLSLLGGLMSAKADGIVEVIGPLSEIVDAHIYIIPFGISFRASIPDDKLATVSCVYHIPPGSSALERLVKLIDDNTSSRERVRSHFEARIALRFLHEDATTTAVYFEDWGGKHPVAGRSAVYSFKMLPKFPDALRALSVSSDVKLEASYYADCPHS